MYLWLLIVPVFAKFFEHIRNTATIELFSYKFTVSLALPFTWQVFYFSALCIVIANVIYQVFCPSIIKDHANYSHFKAEGKGINQLKKYSSQTQFNVELHQLMEQMGIEMNNEAQDEDNLQKLFWAIYENASELHKLARVACVIFLGIGLLLIGWVVVENMTWVIRAILQNA
ncbi:hypothetical protein W01_12210 [Candidatus Nitrotoga sp. AM1P]|nr:hypothetical protein W01_12210 [Candidatus Nitrotoga sp. AM1P]